MGSRTMLLAVLALAAGIAAAIGVRRLAERWEPAAAEETMAVVTVRADVPRGEKIEADDVNTVNWPKSKVPEGVSGDREKIVGRIALTPLFTGQPVFENMLAPPDTLAGLASLVPKGLRAFTILTPTIASGVAGFVLPGNHVDVLLTVSGASQESGGAVTVTLLQSVEILAVDQLLDAPSENRVRTSSLKSVTLLVTPEQAAKLSLAQNKGTLELALRNPEDQTAAGNVPVTIADLRLRGELPDPDALKKDAEEEARLEKEKQELLASLQAEMDKRLEAVQSELLSTREMLSQATASRDKKSQTPPELRIRTLRGTHGGVVLVRPGEQAISRTDGGRQ